MGGTCQGVLEISMERRRVVGFEVGGCMATSRRRFMSGGVTRMTNGWDGAGVDSGGCWGTSSPTRIEKKVARVFNLFALEMPMHRTQVVWMLVG